MAMEPFSEHFTDDELIQIGKDLHNKKIFTSLHIRKEDQERMLPLVFMPLTIMTKEVHEAFIQAEPFVLFEYMEKAGPRSVNGYPGFFSFQFLNKEEWEKVKKVSDTLDEAEKKAMERLNKDISIIANGRKKTIVKERKAVQGE